MSRRDVADLAVAAVCAPAATGRTFEVVSGSSARRLDEGARATIDWQRPPALEPE